MHNFHCGDHPLAITSFSSPSSLASSLSLSLTSSYLPSLFPFIPFFFGSDVLRFSGTCSADSQMPRICCHPRIKLCFYCGSSIFKTATNHSALSSFRPWLLKVTTKPSLPCALFVVICTQHHILPSSSSPSLLHLFPVHMSNLEP